MGFHASVNPFQAHVKVHPSLRELISSVGEPLSHSREQLPRLGEPWPRVSELIFLLAEIVSSVGELLPGACEGLPRLGETLSRSSELLIRAAEVSSHTREPLPQVGEGESGGCEGSMDK